MSFREGGSHSGDTFTVQNRHTSSTTNQQTNNDLWNKPTRTSGLLSKSPMASIRFWSSSSTIDLPASSKEVDSFDGESSSLGVEKIAVGNDENAVFLLATCRDGVTTNAFVPATRTSSAKQCSLILFNNVVE